MLVFLAFATAQASSAGTPAPSPVVSGPGTPVYVDEASDVRVSYVELPTGKVYFSSQLPAGWTFRIEVDGDQNGVWGLGAGKKRDLSVVTSPDYSFGRTSPDGLFCPQYIFTHWEQYPTAAYGYSKCGALKSNGRVIMSAPDSKMRATIQYEVPSDEFFGNRPTARIEVCVWDTKKLVCEHAMPELLELKREFPATMQDSR
jgi:hypothetical protein